MNESRKNQQLSGHDDLERVAGEVNRSTGCQPGFGTDESPKSEQAGLAPLAAQVYPQANTNFTQEVALNAH